MNSLTILASCAVLLAALCFSHSEGACFSGFGCQDAETKANYTEGQKWRTPSCTRCRCSASKQFVAYCLELKKLVRSPKKSASVQVILVEDSDPDSFFKEVELTMEESINFECPPIDQRIYDPQASYQLVTYTVKSLEFSCCTIGYVTSLPQECEARLNKQTCKYKFFTKYTNLPCTAPGPISMVGK